ncbi:MAG TPA: DUF3450 family protein [Lacunisphaera sp.]|nr:DUF3450 family protein [Lacunisphaera sp.]
MPLRRLALLASSILFTGLTAAEPPEDVEKLARELVRLKVETAREETAWRTDRELLTSMVAALQDRAALAEEKLELTRARTAQERQELEALQAKTQAARDDLKVFDERLAALVVRLVAVRPSLPPRLSEALEMSYRTIADPAQPPAERMRMAMNVLNRCEQFNRLVTTGEDVLTPEGETAAKSLQTVYWGLSRGYAIDRATRKAWLGAPGPAGWQWTAKPEAYDRIVQLIAIASDQADPAFVALPAPATKSINASTGGRTP